MTKAFFQIAVENMKMDLEYLLNQYLNYEDCSGEFIESLLKI